MAELVWGNETLALHMSAREKFFSLHGDIVVPRAHVENVEEVPDLWVHLRGMRAPGTGFPGVIMLGTTRFRGGKDFCAVYGHRPGVIVDLRDEPFQRLLITGAKVQ